MLKISKLNAGYGDFQVLHGVSLEVSQGQVAVLMGPNGAGKSTLLKAIFNLVPVTAGQITFGDLSLCNLPTHSLLERGVAYVPQGKINFGTLSVYENLLMGAYHIEDKKVVQENLEKTTREFPVLQKRRTEYAFRLSGGQQQMLALARAMITVPKLLLLDEPSLGLAPKLVKEIFKKIRHLNQSFGTTMLIVEHNIKSVLDIADYGFIMAQGRILAHDSVERLRKGKSLEQVFVGALE